MIHPFQSAARSTRESVQSITRDTAWVWREYMIAGYPPPALIQINRDFGDRCRKIGVSHTVAEAPALRGTEEVGVGIQLSFLGGAGTVTGSKYAVEHEGRRVLVDCGLFQGFKALRLKNWAPFPIDAAQHRGGHPHPRPSRSQRLLCRCWSSAASRGPIFCSHATADLCAILLPDCGASCRRRTPNSRIVMAFRNTSLRCLSTPRRMPARCSTHLAPMPFDRDQHATWRRRRSGCGGPVTFWARHRSSCDWAGTTMVFSGDLGRYDDPTMVDPVSIERADYLVVESTYGNRRHDKRDPAEALGGRSSARR